MFFFFLANVKFILLQQSGAEEQEEGKEINDQFIYIRFIVNPPVNWKTIFDGLIFCLFFLGNWKFGMNSVPL